MTKKEVRGPEGLCGKQQQRLLWGHMIEPRFVGGASTGGRGHRRWEGPMIVGEVGQVIERVLMRRAWAGCRSSCKFAKISLRPILFVSTQKEESGVRKPIGVSFP